MPVKITAKVYCEYWFEKNNDKIRNIRVDTFSQMLSLSNAHAGSRILCVDDIGGLLALGILERMGGVGELVCLHDRQSASLELAKTANLTAKELGCMVTIPIYRLDGPAAIREACTTF